MHFITGGPLQRGPGAIAPVALPLNPALAATLHTYTAIITSHTVCTFKMYCTMHAAALQQLEFTIHLMIVGLLSIALLQ